MKLISTCESNFRNDRNAQTRFEAKARRQKLDAVIQKRDLELPLFFDFARLQVHIPRETEFEASEHDLQEDEIQRNSDSKDKHIEKTIYEDV